MIFASDNYFLIYILRILHYTCLFTKIIKCKQFLINSLTNTWNYFLNDNYKLLNDATDRNVYLSYCGNELFQSAVWSFPTQPSGCSPAKARLWTGRRQFNLFLKYISEIFEKRQVCVLSLLTAFFLIGARSWWRT